MRARLSKPRSRSSTLDSSNSGSSGWCGCISGNVASTVAITRTAISADVGVSQACAVVRRPARADGRRLAEAGCAARGRHRYRARTHLPGWCRDPGDRRGAGRAAAPARAAALEPRTRRRGAPDHAGPGLCGRSRFCASREQFHLFKTCNVWVATAQQAAGVQVTPALTLTTERLMAQLRPLAKV